MKIGIRKPNIKNSIKARTTGKIKRTAKRTINPLYGKKGMGFVNNPKKAIYNKIYNKTSISCLDLFKGSNHIFYNLFIALPLFLIYGTFLVVYYFCKYFILGIIWIFKKIKKLFNNKEEVEN